MQNVSVQLEGNLLVLTVDLDQEVGMSSTGKSILIATTGGDASVAVPGYDEIKVGLNVYRPQQSSGGSHRMASH
jgi:hypothetical protein